ncbi:MAG: hypothetical protein CHACPFDD_01222 [Phycisphaerae bacterium]|nr:hypothetical protein [Phycisphaerae bacterium]
MIAPILAAAAILAIPSQDAGVTYSDYSFGFQTSLPTGWMLDRTRFVAADGGTGVLRGQVATGGRTVEFVVYRTKTDQPFSEWFAEFERSLAAIEGTTRVESRKLDPAADAVAAIEVDALLSVPVKRLHHVTRMNPTTYLVISFAAVGGEPEQVQKLTSEFTTAAQSVRLLCSPEADERLAKALDRGAEEARRTNAAAADRATATDELHYFVRLKGETVGHASFQASREVMEKKAGLRVRERSWRFDGDERAQYSRTDLFASFNGLTELIESQVTQLTAQKGGEPTATTTLDQCIREGDTLFSSFSTSERPDRADSRPPMTVGPAYLSLAWFRRVPRIIEEREGVEFGFAVYDPTIRAQTTQVVRFLGRRASAGGTRPARTYEIREGYAPSGAILQVDDDGNMLSYEAGDMMLQRAAKSAVDERFAARQRPYDAKLRAAARK